MAWRRTTDPAKNLIPIPQELPALLKPGPKSQPKEIFQVVVKLPMQEMRNYQREDGTNVNLITIEEALTEWMNARYE